MGKIHIRNVLVSECYTNCYICKNKETDEGFIVDPGGNALKIADNIDKMNMRPTAILLTHGHFDHIGAVDTLRKKYGVKVYISEKERNTITDSRNNLSAFFGEPYSIDADEYLQDNQNMTLAGFDIKFILTPGHTPGSGCFYLEDEGILFSGDTLFCASRGRTDFPGGSEREIITSIRERLLTLPDETEVFPGHESSTVIESEKVYY